MIENDLEQGTYSSPQVGRHPRATPPITPQGMQDPAKVRMRFPPEPNGYLHIGHAKSIWLNFELAKEYGGVCHLRFDDTNPEKEEQEYVDAIRDAVQWLGYDTDAGRRPQRSPARPATHEYFASNYFDFMYRAAEYLIGAGLAYVDEQSAEEMRANRGDFNTPGTDSPFRARTPEENLARFRAMRDGQLDDGAAVLRAKIDMASPNINMRDPALYRIRRATHHNTGDKWCIYPMYTFAHPIEDALEQITHSICTLEFEDQRPFYDWLLDRLAEGGLIASPHPRQYEFARLNVTHVITSKRKLRQLVEEGHVDGWDDPRMPTLAGLRRRGYTPEALKLFCERSRRHQVRRLDRLRQPRSRAARHAGPDRAARHGGARPGQAGHHQLGRTDGRRRRRSTTARRRCTRTTPRWAGANSSSAAKSGSSAPTTRTCSPRASSACSPATRCA